MQAWNSTCMHRCSPGSVQLAALLIGWTQPQPVGKYFEHGPEGIVRLVFQPVGLSHSHCSYSSPLQGPSYMDVFLVWCPLCSWMWSSEQNVRVDYWGTECPWEPLDPTLDSATCSAPLLPILGQYPPSFKGKNNTSAPLTIITSINFPWTC